MLFLSNYFLLSRRRGYTISVSEMDWSEVEFNAEGCASLGGRPWDEGVEWARARKEGGGGWGTRPAREFIHERAACGPFSGRGNLDLAGAAAAGRPVTERQVSRPLYPCYTQPQQMYRPKKHSTSNKCKPISASKFSPYYKFITIQVGETTTII